MSLVVDHHDKDELHTIIGAIAICQCNTIAIAPLPYCLYKTICTSSSPQFWKHLNARVVLVDQRHTSWQFSC